LDAKKITPMVSQYQAIKAEYPDVLLMFRMGDFYELFGDDAVTASRELEIVLTSRSQGYAADVPMCGMPHHAVDRYIARLIAKGYRVAVCDQLEDPKKTKSLVKRGVTRVVTPGTIMEDGMLEAKSNNYLLAVASAPDAYGLAVVDISTGEFACTEITGKEASRKLLEEIARLDPAEVLLSEMDMDLAEPIKRACRASVTPRADAGFFAKPAKQILCEHFHTDSLRGFGAEDLLVAVEAAADQRRIAAGNSRALHLLHHRLHGPGRRCKAEPGTDAVDVDGQPRRQLAIGNR
jgi:DNA mismatch repair protein MutS